MRANELKLVWSAGLKRGKVELKAPDWEAGSTYRLRLSIINERNTTQSMMIDFRMSPPRLGLISVRFEYKTNESLL
jgi:hypothetical protein